MMAKSVRFNNSYLDVCACGCILANLTCDILSWRADAAEVSSLPPALMFRSSSPCMRRHKRLEGLELYAGAHESASRMKSQGRV